MSDFSKHGVPPKHEMGEDFNFKWLKSLRRRGFYSSYGGDIIVPKRVTASPTLFKAPIPFPTCLLLHLFSKNFSTLFQSHPLLIHFIKSPTLQKSIYHPHPTHFPPLHHHIEDIYFQASTTTN